MDGTSEFLPINTTWNHNKREQKSNESTSWQQLNTLRPAVEEAKSNPEAFWNNHKAETYQGLATYLNVNTGRPKLEIVIPVHHNSDDLPLLLYSLAKQTGMSNKEVTLTLALHNSDDQSKDLARQLSQAIPQGVRIIELDSPLLTGAYAGWQFATGASIGENVLLVDADSAVNPTWANRMLTEMDRNHQAVAATGVRIYHEGSKLVKAYKKVASFYERKLYKPRHGRYFDFIGGNSIVRGDVLREIVNERLIGSLGGDSALELILTQDYGENSIAHVDNPIFNNGSKHDGKNLEYWTSLLTKSVIGKSKLRRIGSLYEVGARISLQRDIATYNPWVRDIVEAWANDKINSGKEVAQMFRSNATARHLELNANTLTVLSRMENDRTENHKMNTHDLYSHLQEISRATFQGAMIEAINRYR